MTTSTIRKFGVGVATAALVASAAVPAFAADYSANRLAGATRYETAIAVANHAFPNGSSVVYIARGDNLVDAIAAGALAKGPLLLVNSDADVQSAVKSELVKLGAAKVVVVGGKGAVSEDTVKAILPSGAVSSRLDGETRYETAAKIAAEAAGITSSKPFADPSVHVYLANGQSMIDALTGGQLPNGVILLTDGTDKLPAATAQALNKHFYKSPVTALGGTAAVSNAALTEANVAKVILTDTFISDFQSEIKAAAEADLKAKGFYTVSSKANKETVLSLIEAAGDQNGFSGTVNRAKAEATWPKIATDLAPNGAYYVQSDADGKVIDTQINVAGTKAQAIQYKALTNEDGDAVVNYMGTTKAKTVAGQDFATKNAVATTLVTSLGTHPSSSEGPGSNIDASVYGSSNSFKQLYGTLNKVGVTPKAEVSTYAELAAALNITLPAGTGASGAWSGTGEDAAAQAAFKGAVQTKLAALQVALNTATSDDKTATDADKTANDTLLARLVSRVPASTLDRISGSDRYATAVAIAKKVYGDAGEKYSPYLYFANGDRFADAAVAGLLDNSLPHVAGPILLVHKDSVPSVTATYAKALDGYADYQRKNIYAIGGTGVISDDAFGKELDVLAPANQASGTISFGTWDTANKKITVTTKDLPNGSTLQLVWEYRDADHTAWKSFTDAAGYMAGTWTGADKLSGTNNDEASFTHTGANAAGAEVRLTVKAVAKNGETITSATSTAMSVALGNTPITFSSGAQATNKSGNVTWTTNNWVPGSTVTAVSLMTGTTDDTAKIQKVEFDAASSNKLTLTLSSGLTSASTSYTLKVRVTSPGYAPTEVTGTFTSGS